MLFLAAKDMSKFGCVENIPLYSVLSEAGIVPCSLLSFQHHLLYCDLDPNLKTNTPKKLNFTLFFCRKITLNSNVHHMFLHSTAYKNKTFNFFLYFSQIPSFAWLPDLPKHDWSGCEAGLICLSRIDQAGTVCLIYPSRINQAGKGGWYSWAGFMILLRKIMQFGKQPKFVKSLCS